MTRVIDFFTNNEVLVILILSCITFLLGRYTSRLDDYRVGMKEINESFYKPFIGMYLNGHHAYA